jgi:DNA topoisomerase-3
LAALNALNPLANKVYEVIVRRFLSIFYPAATYQKVSLVLNTDFPPEGETTREELFHASFKVLVDEGYLKVLNAYNKDKSQDNKTAKSDAEGENAEGQEKNGENGENPDDAEVKLDENVIEMLKKLKKGDKVNLKDFTVKEGETSPPKRYNSGSIILAMENAGQLIEDEELRAQIKGSGIGTSATRAEILKKLININYISLNKKTQILTPSLFGEIIFDVVNASIKSLLNPELTASWEKGLTYVAEGTITSEEYMMKLDDFVTKRVNGVKNLNNQSMLRYNFDRAAAFYKK